ncbi:MAG TPA: tetratricopeptide repeat protein [Caldilineae bacterium]|nr:tetratricopeptide repeat protein [Caldilineae bacterium]
MPSPPIPPPHPDSSTPDQDTLQKANRLLNEGARLLHARRPAEALAPLQEAHALLPDDPDIAITLGGALVMANKWSKAVGFLEKAVEQHPDNARLWLNLAAAYLGRLELSSRTRQDQAIAAYEKAIALDPVAPSAHYNIGLIYAEQKAWPLAAEWFQAALRARPTDRDAATWLKKARAAHLQDQKT